MEETGIRQVELCMRTGIGKSAMSQYLSGAFLPKHDKIRVIADALNVSEAWLMGYDVPRKRIEIVPDTGIMEVVAADSAMKGAHIPRGAVVSVRKCEDLESIDNGNIVCFSTKDEKKLFRFYHRNGDIVALTAADSGVEPMVFSARDVDNGRLVIHGVVEKIEIKLK